MRNRTGGAPLPARNLPPHWRHGHDSAAEAEAKHWAKWANSSDADIVMTCCCLTLAAEAEAKHWVLGHRTPFCALRIEYKEFYSIMVHRDI